MNINGSSKHNVEILAPAGGSEQLIAAVRSGADAVYFGVENFNARRNADNFKLEALRDTVGYCRARNVKTYVALNTLVTDAEITELMKTVEGIAKAAPDAVIVQDLGVARLVMESVPELPLHASTQMSIHNVSGVNLLENMGYSQVVLARELSLKEIKSIYENSSVKLEAFVHGALCMSVSGMCYLSSMLGQRSGNRGLCAQPCRLDFRTDCRDYALSLKDMSYVAHIKELERAGVSTIKIEGRMKRPEYVACAVTACRAALNGEKYDTEILENIFSRGGFTDGYLTGKRSLSMFGRRTKEDAEKTRSVLGKIPELYRNERQSVRVDMEFETEANRKARLLVSDGENSVNIEGDIPQEAINKPLDKTLSQKYLTKTGATPFLVDKFSAHIPDGLSLSASQMNSMRREALEKLMSERKKIAPLNYTPPSAVFSEGSSGGLEEKFRFRYEHFSQFSASDAQRAELLIFPLEEIYANMRSFAGIAHKTAAELPALIFPGQESGVKNMLEKISSAGIKDVFANNLGALKIALDFNMTVHAGFGLNIMNSYALEEAARAGAVDAVLSFELSYDKIKKIYKSLPCGIIGYGYLPLMRFRVCPVQKSSCGKSTEAECSVKDRYGVDFKLLCRNSQDISLLNSVPLYVGDKITKSADFTLLYFTVESSCEASRIIEMYAKHEDFFADKTNGLYFRNIK